MALSATAGTVTATLRNTGRGNANPPIVFQDIRPTLSFSYGIYAKALNNTPATVLFVNGADGSYIHMGHNGINWFINFRTVNVLASTYELAPVIIGQWVLFGICKSGFQTRFFITPEVGEDTPIPIPGYTFGRWEVDTAFTNITIAAGLNVAICNFKYWNSDVPDATFLDHMNRWDAIGAPAPMWSSTLRTPGDVSNIANPYTSADWNSGHAYSLIDFPGSYSFHSPDPAYMAKHSVCPTWIYPIITASVFPQVVFNPGQTPLVATNYVATQFWSFDDKGSIPLDVAFQYAFYYGFPFPTGTEPGPSDTWSAFMNNIDATIVEDHVDPANKFTPADTQVPMPAGLTSANIYEWRFGASFTWQPHTPQINTGEGNLGFLHLFVGYIGNPPGVGVVHVPPPIPPVIPPNPPPDPTLPPPITMAGLYVIVKNTTSDKYNVGIELKIPDPTIRTAYIGE